MEFGIDLGTTRSVIAYLDDTGRPVIVKSALGEDTTPSVVFFESPQHAIVGRAARDEALIAPDLVAQLVKRDMGTSATYTFHGERHTPETVSALILRELARLAADQSGQQVRDVVITVPANFGIAEREATRRAGELAGLVVLDLLDEPVAAAVHYTALNGSSATVRHALMCDLGGGTFDTTAIRLAGDEVTVVCTDGDPRLGGADWDEAIIGILLEKFEQEHPGMHPEQDPQFMQDLLIDADRLKRELGSAESRRHVLRFGGQTTVANLSRSEVEDNTAGLLSRVEKVIDRTVETARVRGVREFGDVLLVGGMSRFPAVAAMMRERLSAEIQRHEPELAVAKGAAIYARALRQPAPEQEPAPAPQASGPAPQAAADASPVRSLAPTRVASVVPRAFGVIGLDGSDPLAVTDPMRARRMVVHLLLANTALPADTGPYTFATSVDNQRMVEIEVWEQASPDLSDDLTDNRKVGKGLLRNLPAHLPARSPIEVTFFMSETGRLTVHAKEPNSGNDMHFDLQIGDFDSNLFRAARQNIKDYEVRG